MPLYRLRRPFWDGRILQEVGAVLEFPEGGAPRTALLVEEPSASEASEAEEHKKEADEAATLMKKKADSDAAKKAAELAAQTVKK